MTGANRIPISLSLPPEEARALAQFVKRATFDDCVRLANIFQFYDSRKEQDVMWSGIKRLRSAFTEAGL